MLPLRYSRRWRVAGIFVLLAVFVGTVAPSLNPWSHSVIRALLSHDKLVHASIFLFLTVWFTGQYARRSYWRVVIGLATFGLFIEICQRFITYRSGDPADVAANLAGIAVGLLIALAGTGGWSLRVEDWLTARRSSA